MKKEIVLFICLFVFQVTHLFAAEKVEGNGHTITKKIDVEEFDQLFLGSGIESSGSGIRFLKKSTKKELSFEYTQRNGSATLVITMDENLFDYLSVEQKGGSLRIQAKENYQILPTLLSIKGGSSALKKVDITGCLNFIVEGALQADELKLGVSGVGNITLSDLSCQVLNGSVSGVGNLSLKGKVDKAKYDLSGVGKIFAYDCVVKELACHVSGVGNMEVRASEKLSAKASGVGSISYKGEATVNANASGVGRIKNAN
ncbi:DUF2807 domain-containing protein [Parabacteroides sp. 52]|uniref:head GIN domain-containing protein n=1 Tax=unclassified Parabacteroides TaxID=2649774 RepID=UPI0013D85644|nr:MULTISPECIES: head GIN domain-containing protein [unclassified Parabacteroides]MDH6535418.1 hypothetical protein [Parabacteroides sp. PM5-20]NDV56062.1 DUF2807 domain-containing protein [Parabacteroides sp. 52]